MGFFDVDARLCSLIWTLRWFHFHSSSPPPPPPHHSAFYRPDALPAAQPTASKPEIFVTKEISVSPFRTALIAVLNATEDLLIATETKV